MKLELGVRAQEIQRDWYGKRGISLRGFLIIAQVEEDKKVTEVIDLWSEDTKQDAWFSQSAMDIGFWCLEKELPGYRVYLFSGKTILYCIHFSVFKTGHVPKKTDKMLISFVKILPQFFTSNG